MPDYDPKSIPILNDVIETENTDSDDLAAKSGLDNTKTDQSEEAPDLFAGNTKYPTIESIISEQADPQIGIIDEDIKSALEDIESALIDYNTEVKESDIATNVQPLADEQIISEDTVSLKSIVDDVTNQLMPNLEQWLRFLIQQALEDRLPDEVINKLNSNKIKPD